MESADNQSDTEENTDYKATRQSIKDSSPFTEIFGNAVAGTELDSDVSDRNERFFPSGFDAIKSIIHLFPLWAGALHHDVHRLSEDTAVSNANVFPRPRSNVKVEGYFGEMKTLPQQHTTSARRLPADVTRCDVDAPASLRRP